MRGGVQLTVQQIGLGSGCISVSISQRNQSEVTRVKMSTSFSLKRCALRENRSGSEIFMLKWTKKKNNPQKSDVDEVSSKRWDSANKV